MTPGFPSRESMILSGDGTQSTGNIQVKDLLQLVGLSAFAVAQPLFDLLARHAVFLVVHRAQPLDVLLMVVFLIAVVPLPLVLLEVAAGLISARLRQGLHLLLLAFLLALIVLQPLVREENVPGLVSLIIAILVGAAGAFAYRRFTTLRRLATVLALAAPLFCGLFLFHPRIARIVFPGEVPAVEVTGEGGTTPVVMVVFDALPLVSLLDEERRIDPQRYPHFAALANDGVWFRQATTVSDNTVLAVPAILTGLYPRPDRQPTVLDWPRNLFTLLGGSHALHVVEPVTNLLMESLRGPETEHQKRRLATLLADISVIYLHVLLPADLRGGLPPVSQSWSDFGAGPGPAGEGGEKQIRYVEEFREFVAHIGIENAGSAGRPGLYFIHSVLPHPPHFYFPSGTAYTRRRLEPSGQGSQWGLWTDDAMAAQHSQQRHLLQLGYVDRLVGELLDRLRATGLYERSLIVITADHGTSFWPGRSHREATVGNFRDIMRVPLLIKPPGGDGGTIDDRNVESVDILPTVADVLGIEIPWKVDGWSALDPDRSERPEKICFGKKRLEFPFTAFQPPDSSLARKLALFGSGRGEGGLFRAGAVGDLVGRSVASLPRGEPADVAIALREPERYEKVDPASGFVPAEIVGEVRLTAGATNAGAVNTRAPAERADLLNLVVAVNGVIRAVTRPYATQLGRDEAVWSALVEEIAFRAGANAVEIFVLETGSAGPILHPAAGFGF